MGDARKTTEIWDIRDKNGDKIGRTMARGDQLNPGDYHLVVHIWIKDDMGRFLIQQRSPHVTDPGIWAPTCGSAIQGEESQEAAIREMREELGLQILPDEMERVTRLVGPDIMVGANVLLDIWQINKYVPIEEIHFVDGEVSEVKWATKSEIEDLMAEDVFPQYGPNYLNPVLW
jgi:8-oxo-dGTP diphosphatase